MAPINGSPFSPIKVAVSSPEWLPMEHLAVTSCFQCLKCSAGCPMSFAMDLLPDQVVRLCLLGQADQVLGCRTIWVCSSCATCSTRCPNGVDVAGIMDSLKEVVLRRRESGAEPEIAAFHRFFLESVQAGGGRLAETRLLRRYTLFKWWRRPDLDEMRQAFQLGWKLWKRGRVRLLGSPSLKGKAEIQKIFQQTRF